MTHDEPSHTTYWPSIVAFGEKVPVAPVVPASPAKAKETVHTSPGVKLLLLSTDETGIIYVEPVSYVVYPPVMLKSTNVFCTPFLLILNLPFILFVLLVNKDNQLLASTPLK